MYFDFYDRYEGVEAVGSAISRREGVVLSVVVHVAILLALMLALVNAALGVVAAMVASHRTAQAAADLAALSGATSLADGGDPCAEATAVATANGARLTSCAVDDRDVRVAVEVTGPR